jgi:hypothetical protein
MAKPVVVAGGWHGAALTPIAQMLRARGWGERSHLTHPGVNLETVIEEDVANILSISVMPNERYFSSIVSRQFPKESR